MRVILWAEQQTRSLVLGVCFLLSLLISGTLVPVPFTLEGQKTSSAHGLSTVLRGQISLEKVAKTAHSPSIQAQAESENSAFLTGQESDIEFADSPSNPELSRFRMNRFDCQQVLFEQRIVLHTSWLSRSPRGPPPLCLSRTTV